MNYSYSVGSGQLGLFSGCCPVSFYSQARAGVSVAVITVISDPQLRRRGQIFLSNDNERNIYMGEEGEERGWE